MKRYDNLSQLLEEKDINKTHYQEEEYQYLGCIGSQEETGKEPELQGFNVKNNKGDIVNIAVTHIYDKESDLYKYYYWV